MIRKAEMLAITALLVAVHCRLALGQTLPPTVLQVDIENVVEYQPDISDLSKIATIPNVTPPLPHSSFLPTPAIVIGDIVAINGQPVKGTVTGVPVGIGLTPAPHAGQAIADTTRASSGSRTFEILKSDGSPIGTIVALGLNGGSSPPGPPFGGQNFAIVGGTGAFLGVRGQEGGMQTPQTIPSRAASISEDPANRRINGGGRVRWLLAVIPASRPEIVATTGGPAVTHSSDFSLVTPSKPAAPGEFLSAFLTGLGPTVPPVDFGQPFPQSPLAIVNSPIDVTVNGKSAEMIAAVGLPGAVDGYQVNFRVPSDTGKGTATVQISAAWIAGPAVNIAIQ